MFRRLWEKLKLLWKLAKSERATPREIFWAVFVGVFAGCTPAVGVHGPLALGMATLFRKNRLFAWLGSRISNMVFLPFIAIAAIQISHRFREGAWLVLDRETVLDQVGELLLDWCIGMFPVGFGLGAIVGGIAYWFAARRDRRKALEASAAQTNESNATTDSEGEKASTPPPAEAPTPSSGSPA